MTGGDHGTQWRSFPSLLTSFVPNLPTYLSAPPPKTTFHYKSSLTFAITNLSSPMLLSRACAHSVRTQAYCISPTASSTHHLFARSIVTRPKPAVTVTLNAAGTFSSTPKYPLYIYFESPHNCFLHLILTLQQCRPPASSLMAPTAQLLLLPQNQIPRLCVSRVPASSTDQQPLVPVPSSLVLA